MVEQNKTTTLHSIDEMLRALIESAFAGRFTRDGVPNLDQFEAKCDAADKDSSLRVYVHEKLVKYVKEEHEKAADKDHEAWDELSEAVQSNDEYWNKHALYEFAIDGGEPALPARLAGLHRAVASLRVVLLRHRLGYPAVRRAKVRSRRTRVLS